MSQLNIKGIISNIKERTNIYTPIIEAIVNSLEAIDETGRNNGKIQIILKREASLDIKFDADTLPNIVSIEVHDNGTGFDKKNRDSFDTLYSEIKINEGGKGFGRFMFLKYFESIRIESVYKNGSDYFFRKFNFGTNNEIIENEKNTKEASINDTNTILFLENIQDGKLDKKIETIAKKLVEKLLIYFIEENYKCPSIILKDVYQGKEILLNDYLSSHEEIKEIASSEFTLQGSVQETFKFKVFKIFYPDTQKSKISLVAHKREVTETPMQNYIPEFSENFYEEFKDGVSRDFMIKTYVLGAYLNKHVSLERVTFNFSKKESDPFFPYSQEDIEREAALKTKAAFPEEISSRQNKKKDKIRNYIDLEAPWHKAYLEDLNLATVPYNSSNEEIELALQKVEFNQETNAKNEIKKILADPKAEITDTLQNLISNISKAGMSQLAHYVALRKTILLLLRKSLEVKPDGKYESESSVHNIIFPTRTNSDTTPYDKHNLWIIDEKLNFTELVSSDEPLQGGVTERADLLIFNKKMAYRGENDSSNPITIFEFKKPQRDDFANPSSKEDPVQQIIRYVNDIKDGKYKTPNGRDILIGQNTPFYGFVVCDFTKKVTDWLVREKDFKPMPDGQGYFQWFSSNNLYIEVISWDKMLKDSEMRNRIFFKKLGLE